MIGEIAQRRPLAGQNRQPAGHEIPEGRAGSVVIHAIAVDEVHRHIEQPVGIGLETEARVENHCGDARARIIRVGPDLRAVREQAVRLALVERRIREQSGGERLQRGTHAHFRHHVGFRGKIQVHLHGAGAQHHVQPARAHLGHVFAHDLVAALGHERHVRPPRDGVEAERRKAEAKPGRHRTQPCDMRIELGFGFMQIRQRRAGELELPAGFQGKRGAIALQPDGVALVGDRDQPLGGLNRGQQITDAARLLIAGRPEIAQAKSESLMLRANGEIGSRLAAGCQIRRQIPGVGNNSRIGVSGVRQKILLL